MVQVYHNPLFLFLLQVHAIQPTTAAAAGLALKKAGPPGGTGGGGRGAHATPPLLRFPWDGRFLATGFREGVRDHGKGSGTVAVAIAERMAERWPLLAASF